MRKLTGRWTLEKTWLGNYKVKVEVTKRTECLSDFTLSPEYKT